MPINPVTAFIGGIQAVVGYAGAAPGFVAGVMQINVQVPAGVPAGSADMYLTINTISSPTVQIQVSQ